MSFHFLICSCLVAVFIHFKSHPFSSSYFDAMASWYSTRSRSRTASRPRPLLFALLPGHPDLRMTTQTLLTTRPPAALTMTALHVGNTPDRHVLIIINFQDLADLSSRLHPLPNNADRLDAECRVHLDAIDEVSLFTWCRHFDHREVIQIPIGNLCHLISTRIRETWDIRIPGTALELRGSDYWGDTVQLAADRTIAETLDTWAPRWRELQYTSTSWQALPQCPCRPFNLALILSSSHSRSHPPLKSVRIEQKRISALRRLFNTSYQIGIPGVT